MGFFLPALFVGGLGVTQHLASRELDDIVRQAEQPVFGFWWGFSLGALTGLWVGCNFGPIILKMKNLVSSVGGWMFLSPPPPLQSPARDASCAAAFGIPRAATGGGAGYPFVPASTYIPFGQQQHSHQQHVTLAPHSSDSSERRVFNSESYTDRGARTGVSTGGSSSGPVLPPFCPSEFNHLAQRPNEDDRLKHALWTTQHQQQLPHSDAHSAGGTATTFAPPIQTPDTEHLLKTEQKRNSTANTWW